MLMWMIKYIDSEIDGEERTFDKKALLRPKNDEKFQINIHTVELFCCLSVA